MGRAAYQIARRVRLSPATVRNQLRSAYGKLGAGSKIDLARQLSETGCAGTSTNQS